MHPMHGLVYEERRKESLKLMADTESRRAQIDEVMSVITSKLSELDADRKELAEYQARLQELQSRKAVLEADIGDLEEKVGASCPDLA
ncbi:SMC hinge domain-containing protein [Haematococcus lacustris]|uniref:SMC hinge domain-containing protein n=1 Tax=Haematococcus lacustris TaxID=44745 RepID=A0A699YKJ2_HAELA|nr:SMC hinge domain-containing protein [Haematococcus lacustris]